MLKEISVTLEQAYKGDLIKFQHKRYRICDECDGQGGEGVKKCSHCKGRGIVTKMVMLGPNMYSQS